MRGHRSPCPFRARQSRPQIRKQCPKRGTDFSTFWDTETGDFSRNAKSSATFKNKLSIII